MTKLSVRLMCQMFGRPSTFWFLDSDSILPPIDLKFDTTVGHHLAQVTFEIGANQCVCLSVHILLSRLCVSITLLPMDLKLERVVRHHLC